MNRKQRNAIEQRKIDYNIGYNHGLCKSNPSNKWKYVQCYMQGFHKGIAIVKERKLANLLSGNNGPFYINDTILLDDPGK